MDANTTSAVAIKKNSTGIVPRKESDLASLALSASKSWKDDPRYTLFWTTQAEFESNASVYSQTVTTSKKAKGSRNPITDTLKKINKDIDSGIIYVKGYIKDKYESSANAYFANYGIEKAGNAYLFPRDRDKRKTALELIVNALVADGFADKKYGKVYFETLRTQYIKLTDEAIETDKSITTHSDSKKGLREYIEKTLAALIHLIQANYPDTSDAQLRIFGFHK